MRALLPYDSHERFRNDMCTFFDPLIQKVLDGIKETATAVDWSVDVSIASSFVCSP